MDTIHFQVTDVTVCVSEFNLFAGHYHIFVGDLSPDVETHHLQAAFSQFGQTS